MKNWKEYNKKLVKRGELILPLELLEVQSYQHQTKKRGRPFLYPQELINVMLFFKFLLGIGYRQTSGFFEKLLKSLGMKTPNFRTQRDSK